MSDTAIEQLIMFPFTEKSCHFKGCVEPVVGSSRYTDNAHVCKHHNALEWARGLVRNASDRYWRQFGEKWLKELEGQNT